MQLVADILLMLGALGAAAYCLILSRRLRRFTDLETGVGGAIAVLSAQVDDMTRSLETAQRIAQGSAVSLDGLTERAEAASKRLELLMASLHDLPGEAGLGHKDRADHADRQEDAGVSARPAPPRRSDPELAVVDAEAPAQDAAAQVALFQSQRRRGAGAAR